MYTCTLGFACSLSRVCSPLSLSFFIFLFFFISLLPTMARGREKCLSPCDLSNLPPGCPSRYPFALSSLSLMSLPPFHLTWNIQNRCILVPKEHTHNHIHIPSSFSHINKIRMPKVCAFASSIKFWHALDGFELDLSTWRWIDKDRSAYKHCSITNRGNRLANLSSWE